MGWTSVAVTLLCAVAIVPLILTGHSEQVAPVAVLGAAAAAGGTIHVTVNIRR